jgi:hypothetical protein
MKTLACLALVLAACSSDSTVSNADDARRAYLGLDQAIDRALNLGLQGFNDSSSANIPPESANGDAMGTLTVTGKVSHGTGASGNSEMTLGTALVTYEDLVPGADARTPIGLVYATDAAALPALDLSLRNIPTGTTGMGTLTGSLAGKVHMSGDLKGDVTLALSFTANIVPVPSMPGKIQRMAGSTHVTGTATSDYGTYTVDVTR